VIIVLQLSSGINLEFEGTLNIDINGDGRVGLAEAIYILKKIAEPN